MPDRQPPARKMTRAHVKHATEALKRHLLDNGVEPAVLNTEAVKAAYESFFDSPASQQENPRQRR